MYCANNNQDEASKVCSRFRVQTVVEDHQQQRMQQRWNNTLMESANPGLPSVSPHDRFPELRKLPKHNPQCINITGLL